MNYCNELESLVYIYTRLYFVCSRGMPQGAISSAHLSKQTIKLPSTKHWPKQTKCDHSNCREVSTLTVCHVNSCHPSEYSTQTSVTEDWE